MYYRAAVTLRRAIYALCAAYDPIYTQSLHLTAAATTKNQIHVEYVRFLRFPALRVYARI